MDMFFLVLKIVAFVLLVLSFWSWYTRVENRLHILNIAMTGVIKVLHREGIIKKEDLMIEEEDAK